ncbi:hypothetical protein F5I97DRAFT_1959733 [Phlebopus sp. FC_14]|nr:hypothetical protein F5I97DRAFT_1959733 [Phlebopus sp. FC_14]
MPSPRKIPRQPTYQTFAPSSAVRHLQRSQMDALPVELLSKIFTSAVHCSHDLYDSITQPITISHVCRHWRHVSLSTTALWTTISLLFPLSTHQLSRTLAWLCRSRNRPLHIHMDFRDPSWNWDEASHHFTWKSMENIMRLLLPHARRWQHVELYTDTWAPIFTFLSYTSHVKSASCLQEIHLARCNAYFAVKGEPFRPTAMALPVPWFSAGLGLPNLRKVSLGGVHVDWAQSGLSGLKELELKYHAQEVMPTLEEFTAIIQACPDLERLAIMGWGPRIDPNMKNHQVISLLHLRKLEFGFVDVDYAIDLFSLFRIPNLSSLTIEDVTSGLEPCEHHDATRLLDRLNVLGAQQHPDKVPLACTPLQCVRTFSLRGVKLGHDAADTITAFLSNFRSLESVLLSNLDACSLRVFCSVVLANKDETYLPCLDRLTLRDIDEAALVDGLAECEGSISSSRHIRIFVDAYVGE